MYVYYNPGNKFVLNQRGFSPTPVKNPANQIVRPHWGQDYKAAPGIASVKGEPVPVAEDGVVLYTGYKPGGMGNFVIVAHKDSSGNYTGVTSYAHLDKPSPLKPGQLISAGDPVGVCGTTGNSTGVHIHFEVRLMKQAYTEDQIIKLAHSGEVPYNSYFSYTPVNPVSFVGFSNLSSGHAISNSTNPLDIIFTILTGSGSAHAGDLDSFLDQKKQASMVEGRQDPFIVDLNGDGQLTKSIAGGAHFDFNSDGFAESAGWVQGGDAILVADLNGNGVIDNGRELFGDQTILPTGERAADGYAALAALDNNGDGILNSSDAAWGTLALWADDGDGVSTPEEIISLAQAGIVSIALTSEVVGEQDGAENIIARANASGVLMADGSIRASGSYLLNVDFADTIALTELPLTQAQAQLPYLFGTGTVYDLAQAAARNPELESQVSSLAASSDLANFSARFEKMLFTWAGVNDVIAGSQGSFVDAKHLAVLNAFSGETFVGIEGSHPNSTAGFLLEAAYQDLLGTYMYEFLTQGPLRAYFEQIEILYQPDGTIAESYSQLTASLAGANASDTNIRSLWYFGQAANFLHIAETPAFKDMVSSLGSSLAGTILDFTTTHGKAADASLLVGATIGTNNITGSALAEMIFGGDGSDSLYGQAGSDYLHGGAGDDNLDGGAGDDVIMGGDGCDRIWDTEGSNIFNGGADDDILGSTLTTAFWGPNVYLGGTGNDTAIGSRGADTYIFNKGDGQDVIRENQYNGGGDVLKFGNDVLAADWIASRAGVDLVLSDAHSLDKITIAQWFDSADQKSYRIDHAEFADGTTWSAADMTERALTVYGTTAGDVLRGLDGIDDVVHGLAGDDVILGFGGNDKLCGDDGADTVYGGAGNDTLQGGAGNDNMDGEAGDDYLSGGAGDDRLYDDQGSNTFDGGDGDDRLMSANTTAFWGPNTYNGGRGNDIIFGSRGGDTYLFSAGDGQDLIIENPYGSGTDVLQFGAGIQALDFSAARQGDNLVLTGANGVDKLTFQDWFWAPNGFDSRIELFQFADGNVLTGADVVALVGAPNLAAHYTASMFTI